MSFDRWPVASAALFLIVSASMAEELPSPDPLFQSTEILDVRIVAPLETLLADRPIDEELPASFQYVDSAGQTVEFDIQIRTRGRFRRQKYVCAFPPLRLNFKASETKGSGIPLPPAPSLNSSDDGSSTAGHTHWRRQSRYARIHEFHGRIPKTL